MDVIFQIIGAVFAGFGLRLALNIFKKKEYATSLAVFSVASFVMLCSFPWFQGWAKAYFASNLRAKLAALGEQVNTVQAATTEMQGQLDIHQKQINEHQTELNSVQSKIRKTQSEVMESQNEITNQYDRLSAMQEVVSVAQTNLEVQQKKIEDVEYLASNLFSKTVKENMNISNTNRVIFLKDFGDAKRFGFLLSHAAIPASS